jgi:hypothetical protein
MNATEEEEEEYIEEGEDQGHFVEQGKPSHLISYLYSINIAPYIFTQVHV